MNDRELKLLLTMQANPANSAAVQQLRADILALNSDQAKLAALIAGPSERVLAYQQSQATQAALINGVMERRVILETQLEAAEARIAGNPAMAVKLEREAAIRAQALNIQRTLNITTEESIVLAERMVIAQEAGAVASNAMGINMSRAKTEALVLGRELAAGNVRASTLSSLVGSLGTSFTISSLAAFEIYNALSSAADESLRLTIELQKQTAETERQASEWRQIAATAGDTGDVLKLGESVESSVQKAWENLGKFRNQLLPWYKSLSDAITGGIPDVGAHFQAGKDQDIQSRLAAVQSLVREGIAWKETAQAAVKTWDQQNLEPLDTAIVKQSALVDQAKKKYDDLSITLHKLAVGNLDEAGTADAIRLLKEADQAGALYQVQKKRLDELTGSQENLDKATEKLAEQIKQADFKDLDPSDRLKSYNDDVLGIQQKLREIGVEAATPAEALEQSKNFSADWRKEIIALVEVWRVLLGLISQTTNEQEAAAAKARQQEINVLLRQQAAALQSVHEQQQLINANSILTADQKQALTLASMTAELLKFNAAIQQDKALLQDSTLDPVMHERLQQQLQKDQFEFELLQLKIAAIDKPLSTELTNWVNSFGTQAHQVAGLIEGTINASLEGTNQLLLDSIFRTGDWKQTLMGVERQIGNLFLTFIEHQIESFILGETQKTTATATGVASAAALAAGYAPAAAGSSIATGGTTAIIGEIAAIAAIAAILAALTGAFKKGGLTGTNQIARVGEEGPEFVFSHRATQNIGAENLYAWMHAAERAPRFASGGVFRRAVSDDIEPGWLPGANLPDDFFGRTGPIVDLGFGERPIFHWPYGGPNRGGYIVESGITVYPGLDDEPAVVTNPYGLPTQPSAPTPGLFPGDQPIDDGMVTVYRGAPGSGGVPVWWSPSAPTTAGLPWWSTFNPSLGSDLFANTGDLGFGNRPIVSTAGTGIQPNTARGTWEMYNPDSGVWETVGHLGETAGDVRDRLIASGQLPSSILNPPSSSSDDRSGNTGPGGGPPVGGAGAPQYDDYGGGFYGLFGRPVGEPAPGAVSEEQFANWFRGGGGSNSLAQLLSPPRELADGARIPGGPSRADNVPAWLSPGERVIDAFTELKLAHTYGDDWPQRFASFSIDMPRFASGGRVGAQRSEAGSQRSEPKIDVHVYNYTDIRKAQRDYEESPHARKVLRKNLGRYL